MKVIEEEFEEIFIDSRAQMRLNAKKEIEKAQKTYKESFDKKRK